MAQHQLLAHTNCNIPNCAICSGAVKICTICGGVETEGGEKSLTTNCCEVQITDEQRKAISTGDLDFINGRWFDKRLGPTVKEKLEELGETIATGHRFGSRKKGLFICVGVYENSAGNTVYSFHQIVNKNNRADPEFASLIHYQKFVELFGEL